MAKNISINNVDLVKGLFLLRERIQTSADTHQLEFVKEFKGVYYVNDAKSIRVTATRNSLEVIEAPVVLIIGGEDTDCDYSILLSQIKKKVVSIIYLGENSDRILKYCSVLALFFLKVNTLNEAVQVASLIGHSGDIVLFSPACQSASENYIKRGNEFKEAIKKILD